MLTFAEPFDLRAQNAASYRLAVAKRKSEVTAAADGPKVKQRLHCPLCDRDHWRPDLWSRCVRCELRASTKTRGET